MCFQQNTIRHVLGSVSKWVRGPFPQLVYHHYVEFSLEVCRGNMVIIGSWNLR